MKPVGRRLFKTDRHQISGGLSMDRDFITPRLQPFTVPDSVTNPAKWTFERIAKQINQFEGNLGSEEEIGLRLVSTPGASVMHVEDVGYWGPDMVIYYGTNEHGKPMELMQHYTQTSLLLTAVPKIDEKPKRIGFHLIGKLDEEED